MISWEINFGQEPLRFTTKQGLPSNHIYDVAEDENGFMWFASKQGLIKYDGVSFKIFTIKDGLPNNDTWLLEPDFKGRLWYFSKSNRQGYIENDSIYSFSTPRNEVISPGTIYKSKDSMWISSSSGIQVINEKNISDTELLNVSNTHSFSRQISIVVNEEIMPSIYNPEIKEILFVKNDSLSIYDWNFNFKKNIHINPSISNARQILIKQGVIYNQIAYLAFYEGFLFFDASKNKAQFLSFKELVGIEKAKDFRCRALKDEIQISIPGYLFVFDYNLNLKSKYEFPENLSRSSYKDRNGNFWLTDISNGISMNS